MKRSELMLSTIFLIVLFSNLVLAGGVGYVVKNNNFVDKGFVESLNGMGFNVDIITDNEIPTADFSSYNLIFVGKGKLMNVRNIPMDMPIVTTNYYHGEEFGFTDRDGISRRAANKEMRVIEKDSSEMFEVYDDSVFKLGSVNVPYFYLSMKNKADGITGVATVYRKTNPIGEVVAYKEDSYSKKCFFGIVETDFWTEETERLFINCVNFAAGGRIHDVKIDEEHSSSVNGIRIKDLESDEFLLNGTARLNCSNSYMVDYKIINDGNYVEIVELNGSLGNFSWGSIKNNFRPGESTTESKILDIDELIESGIFDLEITATISGSEDETPGNNFRSREVEIVCELTAPEEDECVIDTDCSAGFECTNNMCVVIGNETGMNQTLIHDVKIDESLTNAVNSIRIKNESGEFLLDEISELMCGKYTVSYRTLNVGNFTENITLFGMLGNFNWSSSRENLSAGDSTTAGSKTITINNETFSNGNYNLTIMAAIDGAEDAVPQDNVKMREVKILCNGLPSENGNGNQTEEDECVIDTDCSTGFECTNNICVEIAEPTGSWFCADDETTRDDCLSLSSGKGTRCYLNAEKSTWDFCSSGWVEQS